MQHLPSAIHPLFRPAFLLSLLSALLLLPLPAVAQPAPRTVAAIESLRSFVETSTLDEVQREAARNQLNTASAQLRSAEDFRQRAASLQGLAARQASKVDGDAPSTEIDPEESLEEWIGRLPSDADAEALERMLQQQRATLDERTTEIERVAAALAETVARPAEIPAEIAVLGRAAEELAAPD